jgi:hypothetical protein
MKFSYEVNYPGLVGNLATFYKVFPKKLCWDCGPMLVLVSVAISIVLTEMQNVHTRPWQQSDKTVDTYIIDRQPFLFENFHFWICNFGFNQHVHLLTITYADFLPILRMFLVGYVGYVCKVLILKNFPFLEVILLSFKA